MNADCRTHDLSNLYIMGGSVFPTVSWANPTFTLMALTFRLADHLCRRLNPQHFRGIEENATIFKFQETVMLSLTNGQNKRLASLRDWASRHELAASIRPLGTIAVVLGVLSLVALGMLIVWKVPMWQVSQTRGIPTERLGLENEFRKTIAQIVLSFFGLLIIYFTWRRTRASDETVRIMEQGQITDRFTKAIKQLGKLNADGSPNIEVRLGAIYALERIALDSPRDHWTIMEVLTAYVRQNAPLTPEQPASRLHRQRRRLGRHTGRAEHPYTDGEKPRADIQAILTALGRRKISAKRERLNINVYIKLMPSRLCGANLNAANFKGADLEKVALQGATFWGADLRGAALVQANFQSANFRKAMLQGAFFREAIMDQADLTEANLSDARDLTIAQIRSARNWHLAYYSPDVHAKLVAADENAEVHAAKPTALP